MDKKSPAQATSTKDSAQPVMPPMPNDVSKHVSNNAAKNTSALEASGDGNILPPEGFVAVPAEEPAKKHTTLIVSLLSLVIVVLLGIAVAVWYFVCYSNPEKVAYDAINGFLQQEAIETNGMINGRGTIGNQRFLFTIDIDSKKGTGVSGENTANLKLTPVDANGQGLSDGNYEVEFGVIMLSDGVFYVRTDKLAEAAETLAAEMGFEDDEEVEIFETVLGLLEEVDGEWWRISVPELIDEFIDSADLARSSKEFYACLMNVANSNSNDQLADIYSNNRFVNIERDAQARRNDWTSEYVVSLDYDAMASFSNTLLKTETVSGTENCVRKFVTEGLGGNNLKIDYTETNAEALRNMLGDVEIRMAISDFGHELKEITFDYGDSHSNGDYFGGELSFSYPDIMIAPPSKYRPFDDLLELIGVAIIELGEIDIDSLYEDEDWDLTIDGTFEDEDFWT